MGLSFPLPFMIFFHYCHIHPVDTHVNVIRVLLGVCFEYAIPGKLGFGRDSFCLYPKKA